jgi:hypothetical protein
MNLSGGKSTEVEDTLTAIANALAKYAARELSLDISGRLPTFQEVYLVDEGDFAKINTDPEYLAFTVAGLRRIVVQGTQVNGQTRIKSVPHTNHEYVHGSAFKQLKHDPVNGGLTVMRDGLYEDWDRYNSPGIRPWRVVNELATERIARNAQRYWEDEPLLNFIDTDPGYVDHNILAKDLFAKVSRISGVPEDEIWHNLEVAVFTGDISMALGPMAIVLSPSEFDALERWNTINIDNLSATVSAFGINVPDGYGLHKGLVRATP